MIFASKNRHLICVLQPLKLHKTPNFSGGASLPGPHRGPKTGPWTPPVARSARFARYAAMVKRAALIFLSQPVWEPSPHLEINMDALWKHKTFIIINLAFIAVKVSEISVTTHLSTYTLYMQKLYIIKTSCFHAVKIIKCLAHKPASGNLRVGVYLLCY